MFLSYSINTIQVFYKSHVVIYYNWMYMYKLEISKYLWFYLEDLSNIQKIKVEIIFEIFHVFIFSVIYVIKLNYMHGKDTDLTYIALI